MSSYSPRLPWPVTAIIVAGGKSTRMKTDKCLLPIENCTLIEFVVNQFTSRFDQTLVSSNNAKHFPELGVEIVPDLTPNKGPVMGIVSAMQVSRNELNFIHACDIPEVDFDLVQLMLSKVEGFDAIVPKAPDGRLEPLCAFYRKSAIPAMERVLEKERGTAHKIVDYCNAQVLPVEKAIRNLNTPLDYRGFIDEF